MGVLLESGCSMWHSCGFWLLDWMEVMKGGEKVIPKIKLYDWKVNCPKCGKVYKWDGVAFRKHVEKCDEQLTKTCVECGEQFTPKTKSQKFCPAKEGNKRSTCENTFNQRIKRQNAKKRSVEENGK